VRTLSFYEIYRNGDSANTQPGGMADPGRASGGFCALGGGRRRVTGTALAGGLAAAAIAFRRRRRRRSGP
jgi:hypothetical protein